METKPNNMIARAWALLTKPHPSIREIGEQRRAQLLASLTLILLFGLTLGLLSSPTTPQTFLGFLVVALAAYLLSRTPYHRAGIYFFTFAFASIAYLTIYFGSASSIDSAINIILPFALILASALLSQWGLAILATLALAATLSLPIYADPKYLDDPSLSIVRSAGVTFSMAAILLGINIFRASIERERLKQIGDSNRELEQLTNDLEQRVLDRTTELNQVNSITLRRASQLEAIAELSQAISQVQDPNKIFSAASQLISERFGFYHVGIFLVDRDREFAILQAANSAGGQKMLARRHRLMLGTGVVGFAAQTGKPRIALDVGADAVFFNNPDLPDTRSEIALPMIVSNLTIGVLDVQSIEAGAFSEEDYRALGTLANQLAIAIENARLLTEARASAKQVQEVFNNFIRTEWSRTAQKAEQAGFRYNAGRIELLESPLENSDIASAVDSGNLVSRVANRADAKHATATIPVKLRGEIIGVLHIEASDPSRTWKDDELSLMEAVAERAAFAMENARLFQDARRRAAKERMIAEATSSISGSLNVENILQATAVELERVLGGSEVLIKFSDRNNS
ncbi:MAG: GAF domain-containing protein [Anaerolineales bacterium]|nr:GAF domain-containing protein [Anaerolineales bacterium]